MEVKGQMPLHSSPHQEAMRRALGIKSGMGLHSSTHREELLCPLRALAHAIELHSSPHQEVEFFIGDKRILRYMLHSSPHREETDLREPERC